MEGESTNATEISNGLKR